MGQSDQPAGRNKVLAISSERHIGKYQNLTFKKIKIKIRRICPSTAAKDRAGTTSDILR